MGLGRQVPLQIYGNGTVSGTQIPSFLCTLQEDRDDDHDWQWTLAEEGAVEVFVYPPFLLVLVYLVYVPEPYIPTFSLILMPRFDAISVLSFLSRLLVVMRIARLW